jgi:myo-inositol-hexaphosphate 3-phosphohydrolase
MDINLCTTFKWTTSEPTLWVHRAPCFKISVIAKFKDSVFVIYSKQGNFGVYDLSLNKLQSFDNIGGQKIYLI